MKIALDWLLEWVPALPAAHRGAAAVAEALTQVGFEVEGITPRGAGLGGILVAEVLAVRPHPKADKLRLVRVRAGAREDEVVCGAANVPGPGGLVAWAAPGARLPGMTIAAKEVRGVMSPGMLCSEAELGLASEADGILILSTERDLVSHGDDLVAASGLADAVIEVNVTPNRPDALSHLGLARELAAAFNVRAGAGERVRVVPPPVQRQVQTGVGPTRDVHIEDPGACPRYQARFITGLSVGESAFRMRTRLEACGVRAISNLVDVTNYVLLDVGHPLHAFDQAKIEGDVTVRRARAGERMHTLDGVERALVEGDVVIADRRGPIALAGVMGGATTEVSAATRDVLLEAATFDPIAIRRTARRLGLHSEASYRFERGVDAEGIPFAAERAARLMAVAGGGVLVNEGRDEYPGPVPRRRVSLPLARLSRVAGKTLWTADRAAARLAEVVTAVEVEGEESLHAEVPTFRRDLGIAEDLIEEVMRLEGFAAIAPAPIAANVESLASPEGPADRARLRLAALGLNEIVTWAFVPRAWLAALANDGARGGAPLALKNPLSADYEVMRTSLLPGLLSTAARNLARGVERPGIFEVGPVVLPGTPLPVEPTWLGALVAGPTAAWLEPGPEVDFFDAKQVAVDVLAAFAVTGTFRADAVGPHLHPGVAAAIVVGGARVGAVGEVHPRVRRAFALDVPAFYVEMDVTALALLGAAASGAGRRVMSPPRFPSVTRDISFWVAAEVSADAQEEALRGAAERLLNGAAVLQDFRDPRHVPAGKKGMLWRLTYQADDRTLRDEEVDAAHARVLAALRAALQVEIR
jgi:phenylalanyl-tRNA synthetase beta chain